jgi:energy-coupling factor transport system permease protein
LIKMVLYIPGSTLLHRLYPLTKLAVFILVMLVGFAFFNPLPSLLLSLTAIVAVALMGKRYLAGVYRPLILILPAIFAMIFFQAFFPIEAHPRPFVFLNITVYYNGLYYGLELASRVILAITWGVFVILVTHPGDLFTSLRKIKVPYLFGFMVLNMLQFVPILLSESNTIMEAQQSRGLKLRGFRAVLPNLVPLFVAAWERGQVLAMSMEVRGMGSSGKKTSFRKVSMRPIDALIVAAGMVLAILCVSYSYLNGYFNYIDVWAPQPMLAGSLAVLSLVGFGLSMLTAVASYRA